MNSPIKKTGINLQTAQNHMLQFVVDDIAAYEKNGSIQALINNAKKIKQLFSDVQNRLFILLSIPLEQKERWHTGITDSGKRTIELAVNFFCPDAEKTNIVVNTENYAAFNKFSAAAALKKQKSITFDMPFNLKPGQALTVNSEAEFDNATHLIEKNKVKTLWIAWNSTSTGVQEKIERLVEHRNACGSDTLIIADAASMRLFTKDWEALNTDHYPDVFFFSLRKQGLPYDGPQDELNQMQNSGALLLFDDRAVQRAKKINAKPIYDSPSIDGLIDGQITKGEQRINHIRHLLKLNVSLKFFLKNNGIELAKLDQIRNAAKSEIIGSFAEKGVLGKTGYSLLADVNAHSSSTYVIKVPDNQNAKKIISSLKGKGILISPSLHPLLPNDKIIRFSCYTGNTIEEIKTVLSELASI